jgi:HD-GYP domain-containing protein (c-di-GMP phosphodiesterase class II)
MGIYSPTFRGGRELSWTRTSSEVNAVMTLVPNIEPLVAALREKDYSVLQHSERAARYACVMGRSLGLKNGQLLALQKGGVLHDLGKLSVPSSILLKPGTLTADEWEIMRRHPAEGYTRLVGVLDETALDIVLYHHEWYDGRGYPAHLVGDRIPVLARIFSIADAYDAMTSDRPCRRAMSPYAAREEVQVCSGRQFDPVLAQVFVDAFDEILLASRESVRQSVSAPEPLPLRLNLRVPVPVPVMR